MSLVLWWRLRSSAQLARAHGMSRTGYLEQWLAWSIAQSPVPRAVVPTFTIREERLIMTPSGDWRAVILETPQPSLEDAFLYTFNTRTPIDARRILEERANVDAEQARLVLERTGIA